MAKIVNSNYPVTKVGNVVINTSKRCHTSNYNTYNSRTIKYIVMHYTGNYEDTAAGNANYFTGANRGASAHFFVDDNSIWQSIGLKDVAWHAGAYDEHSFAYHAECRNVNSIGIEMCCTAGNYDMSAKTVELSAKLCAELCKYLGITDVEKYVVRHYDVIHKECPRPMVRDTARWKAFKKRVAELLNVKITPSTETNSNPVLEYGDEGSAVKSLQQRLIALGYSCGSAGADGDFGSGTEAAVIKFQKAMQIDADGVVGDQTYAALTKAEAAKKTTTTTTKTSTVTYDATPDDIKEVQTWMNKNYSSGLVVDGGYGPLTKAAIVKAVQKQIGTAVDGSFGPNSKAKWNTLLQNGSSGKLVQLVQCMLICQGYSVGSDGADGAFGNDTKAAVTRFQKNKKIQADGIIGKETAYYLFH